MGHSKRPPVTSTLLFTWATPAGHVQRRGCSGPAHGASNRLRQDAVLGFPTGVLLLFPPGPGPCGVRVAASVVLLLASGCREVRPGRQSSAHGSSLSVFHEDGAGSDPEDGTPPASRPGPKRPIFIFPSATSSKATAMCKRIAVARYIAVASAAV